MTSDIAETTVMRERLQVTETVTVDHGGHRFHMMSTDLRGKRPAESYRRALDAVRALGGHVLAQFVLGGCRHEKTLRAAAGGEEWPVTWLQGDACGREELYACQTTAVSGADVRVLRADGRVVGTVFENDCATVCRLASVLPKKREAASGDQAREVFETLERVLADAGLTYNDVVRTWIFLRDLLSWYREFNDVRTAFYQEHGVFGKLLPASTGIGAWTPSGAAIVVDALAIRPKRPTFTIDVVPSPLQGAATAYRSSFSRAIEIGWPKCRELMISGTASIDEKGQTVFIGDTARQIAMTMEVVEAILNSRGMSWADVTRSIAYFRHSEEIPLFEAYCRGRRLPPFPVAVSHSTICRDDLLFEIEADAARAR